MAGVRNQRIEIDISRRVRSCLGARGSSSLHMGMGTGYQFLDVVCLIGIGLGLASQHLVDKLTEVMAARFCGIVNRFEIKAINLGLGQHAADARDDAETCDGEEEEVFAHRFPRQNAQQLRLRHRR